MKKVMVLSFDCVEDIEFGIKMRILTFDINKLYDYFKKTKDCFVLEYYIKKYKETLPNKKLILHECFDNYNMVKLFSENCDIFSLELELDIIFKLKDINVIELLLRNYGYIEIKGFYFIDCNKDIYGLLKNLLLEGINFGFDHFEFEICKYDIYFNLDKDKIQELFLLVIVQEINYDYFDNFDLLDENLKLEIYKLQMKK